MAHTQEEEQKYYHQQISMQKGPVSDILLWVECFATLVLVPSLVISEGISADEIPLNNH